MNLRLFRWLDYLPREFGFGVVQMPLVVIAQLVSVMIAKAKHVAG